MATTKEAEVAQYAYTAQKLTDACDSFDQAQGLASGPVMFCGFLSVLAVIHALVATIALFVVAGGRSNQSYLLELDELDDEQATKEMQDLNERNKRARRTKSPLNRGVHSKKDTSESEILMNIPVDEELENADFLALAPAPAPAPTPADAPALAPAPTPAPEHVPDKELQLHA